MPNGESPSLASGTRRNGHNGVAPGSATGSLTPRQEEVLLFCVRAGYYEIPRRKTLRALAVDLGISVTSLSLILRRAEAKLVQGFARDRVDGAKAASPTP